MHGFRGFLVADGQLLEGCHCVVITGVSLYCCKQYMTVSGLDSLFERRSSGKEHACLKAIYTTLMDSKMSGSGRAPGVIGVAGFACHSIYIPTISCFRIISYYHCSAIRCRTTRCVWSTTGSCRGCCLGNCHYRCRVVGVIATRAPCRRSSRAPPPQMPIAAAPRRVPRDAAARGATATVTP